MGIRQQQSWRLARFCLGSLVIAMVGGCGGAGNASHDEHPIPASPASIGEEADSVPAAPTLAPAAALLIQGAVATPIEGTVVVMWTVSSGSPDYAYIYGRGQASGGSFSVELSAPPPAEALNSYGLGVGTVLLYPHEAAPPDGRLERGVHRRAVGAAARFGIIYRLSPTSPIPWMEGFNAGYGCGLGVEREPGARFDSFAPVACEALEIDIADFRDLEFVNWT